jgi:hypothetical protein
MMAIPFELRGIGQNALPPVLRLTAASDKSRPRPAASNRPNLIGRQDTTVLWFCGNLQGGTDEKTNGALHCAGSFYAVRGAGLVALAGWYKP